MGNGTKSTAIRAAFATGIALMLLAESAMAFRCGSKLVVEGMHEVEVIRACGEPVSTQHVGFVMKAFDYDGRRGFFGADRRYYPNLSYDVPVTEMVFNFGPRKFMRKLRFEGGELVKIETLGYGYTD